MLCGANKANVDAWFGVRFGIQQVRGAGKVDLPAYLNYRFSRSLFAGQIAV